MGHTFQARARFCCDAHRPLIHFPSTSSPSSHVLFPFLTPLIFGWVFRAGQVFSCLRAFALPMSLLGKLIPWASLGHSDHFPRVPVEPYFLKWVPPSKILYSRPHAVTHACNPALWEAKPGRSPEVGSSRPAWPTWQNPVSTKNKTIRQAWWHL